MALGWGGVLGKMSKGPSPKSQFLTKVQDPRLVTPQETLLTCNLFSLCLPVAEADRRGWRLTVDWLCWQLFRLPLMDLMSAGFGSTINSSCSEKRTYIWFWPAVSDSHERSVLRASLLAGGTLSTPNSELQPEHKNTTHLGCPSWLRQPSSEHHNQ